MGARLQCPVADLHLKVDRLAEKHLLIDASLPDVLALRPRFGKLDIFWPHRKDHLFARLQRFDRPDLHFAENRDRKSTRLNSSHGYISYAVFCLKKKKST